MPNINGGVLDGVRRIGGRFRDLAVDGGLPGVPLGYRLRGATQSGPPSSGTWRPGDVVPDRTGAVWTCTTGGTPGRWISTGTVATPTGDTTGIKDTPALQAAIISGRPVAPGTYYVSNLYGDSQQILNGMGRGVILQAIAGTSGALLSLATPASTYQFTARNVTIIPNTGSLIGVQLDNTGFTGGGGETDSLHRLENVYVRNAGGAGISLGANIRSLECTGCKVYGAGADGIDIAVGTTDCTFTGTIVGVTAGHGWNVSGWNNMFAACKGFYGGYSGGAFDTTHSAWLVSTNAAYNTFASCSAQNGALHGWDLQSCTHCAFVGCEADNNSSGTGTAGAGFNTNGITYCTIIGATGNSGQSYGIQVAGTQTNTVLMGNTVTGTVGPFNYVSGGGYFLVNPGSVDFSGQNVQFANVDVKVAGAGLQVKEGSNCKQGTAVLNGTTAVVVANTSVTANSRIFLTHQSSSGVPGVPYVTARTAGTSFTIVSTAATDLGTVAFEIFEPG